MYKQQCIQQLNQKSRVPRDDRVNLNDLFPNKFQELHLKLNM